MASTLDEKIIEKAKDIAVITDAHTEENPCDLVSEPMQKMAQAALTNVIVSAMNWTKNGCKAKARAPEAEKYMLLQIKEQAESTRDNLNEKYDANSFPFDTKNDIVYHFNQELLTTVMTLRKEMQNVDDVSSYFFEKSTEFVDTELKMQHAEKEKTSGLDTDVASFLFAHRLKDSTEMIENKTHTLAEVRESIVTDLMIYIERCKKSKGHRDEEDIKKAYCYLQLFSEEDNLSKLTSDAIKETLSDAKEKNPKMLVEALELIGPLTQAYTQEDADHPTDPFQEIVNVYERFIRFMDSKLVEYVNANFVCEISFTPSPRTRKDFFDVRFKVIPKSKKNTPNHGVYPTRFHTTILMQESGYGEYTDYGLKHIPKQILDQMITENEKVRTLIREESEIAERFLTYIGDSILVDNDVLKNHYRPFHKAASLLEENNLLLYTKLFEAMNGDNFHYAYFWQMIAHVFDKTSMSPKTFKDMDDETYLEYSVKAKAINPEQVKSMELTKKAISVCKKNADGQQMLRPLEMYWDISADLKYLTTRNG